MTHVLPDTFSTDAIVDGFDLRFDAGDELNGSLYVCTARGSEAPTAALARLRDAGLFSADAEKAVAEEQRDAYRAGLEFVDAAAFDDGGQLVVLARFDHPKFPSDAARWAAWVDTMDAACERLR